jgi:hypothetical protein
MLTYKSMSEPTPPAIQQDQAEGPMYVKSVIPHIILEKILTNMFVIVIQIEK